MEVLVKDGGICRASDATALELRVFPEGGIFFLGDGGEDCVA